jgi:rod shape-determining protein MreC
VGDVETVKSPRFVTIVLCVIFVFFVGQRLFFFTPTSLDAFASSILYPFLSIEHGIATHCATVYNRLAHAKHIYNEYQLLQQKYEAVYAQLVQYKATNAFYENTKELHDFAERYNYTNGLIVQIIARCTTSHEHTIFIDAGSYKGIELDRVLVWKNALIGKVIEIYPYYSKVRLITDPASKVAVVCSTTGARGICQGAGSLSELTLNFVNHFDNLICGDLLLSSGDGLIFPEGFSLGTIVTVQPEGLYYKSTVQPYVNIATIQYVYVYNKNGVMLDTISTGTAFHSVVT